MIKIAIITPGYCSETSSAYGFVHARAKLYESNNFPIKVFVPSRELLNYKFENVNVEKNKIAHLQNSIKEFEPDVLAVHYPTYNIIKLVKDLKFPKVTWVHGHEVLWYFHLKEAKNPLDYIKKRLILIPRLFYQIIKVRKFISCVEYSVFVSKWMLKAAEKNTLKKYKNSVIIPNPVDTNLFCYKTPTNLTKAISLRSFANTKYGLQYAIKAFANFTKAKLHLIGRGRFKAKFQNLILKYHSNADIIDQTFHHSKIPDLYYKYGFFIAPSRIEAQGLAMCEAMSCGLPVIASNIGGIPEFVRDKIDGYLVPPKDPKKIINAVELLISNKEKMLEMSRNARQNIENICSEKVIVSKEIEILEKSIEKYKSTN